MRAALLTATLAVTALTACPRKDPVTIDPPRDLLLTLEEGRSFHGFRADALYLDDAGGPMGARLVHERTGFTLDYLRIESAPQGFVWVGTYPTSDMGEPHTQEHLLLGKGAKGRWSSSVESMSLVESSAFTAQWRTCYHFHTIAGPEVFWSVLDTKLDALLDPDYTDEEIRREVRNFGVSAAPDGTLRLEEKGTVYQEMVRTYESPWSRLFRAVGHATYGADHPLAYEAGGTPDAIREMTPEHIRTFHREHYHLANMGMVGAFPASMPLDRVLDRTSAILHGRARGTGEGGAGAGRTGAVVREGDLPPPAPAAGYEPGAVAIVEYPYSTASATGPLVLAWPANHTLDPGQRLELELFLSAFAGDESTNLYKRLVDGKTRTLDVGATAAWGWTSSDQGQPIYIGVTDVRAEHLTDAGAIAVRAEVTAEIARVAALPDGDPELAAIKQRMRSRIVDLRRRLTKFLNSPPGFGFRGSGDGWLTHLDDLMHTAGFRKSLTQREAIAAIEASLAGEGNPWRTRIEAWGLLATPTTLGARPSPEMLARLDAEREARVLAEMTRLRRAYRDTADDAALLARYQADYDARTRELEEADAAAPMPPFIDAPPMTLDDELHWTSTTIGRVPVVSSTFDNMTGATVGLAFRVDGAPDELAGYLGLLPALMSDTGLFEDGVALANDEMREQLRAEILGVSVYLTSNIRTRRLELVVEAAGNDVAETRRALQWMRRLMTSSDWRTENLARLRDLVDQSLQGMRNRMLGAEEGWVNDPPRAWWRQQDPLYLHASSFLTRAHDAHRLRWQLLGGEAGDPDVARAAALLDELAVAALVLDRAALRELAKHLEAVADAPREAAPAFEGRDLEPRHASLVRTIKALPAATLRVRTLAREAGRDLGKLLSEIPDDSLAGDWAFVCREMAAELRRGPAPALAAITRLRDAVIGDGGARGWIVGAARTQEQIAGDVAALVARLPATEAPAPRPVTGQRAIAERLRARMPAATAPAFVGLVNPNTQSGVFVHSAASTHYSDVGTDTGEDALLDYLAGNLYTGGGAHSLFMKTWAAGLAYSNGIRPSLELGRMSYYAERCPELPQTMRFVIGELDRAEADPSLVDYAVAQAFDSRIASGYEGRGSAMAADLADGLTPEIVRGFRERLLAVRGRAGLADELVARMKTVYGHVLPGLGPPALRASAVDPVYFVIGPEKQLDAWQRYLTAVEGADATLWRLYPRDFWLVSPGPR